MSNITYLRSTIEGITIPYGEKVKLLKKQELKIQKKGGGNIILTVMGNNIYINYFEFYAIKYLDYIIPSFCIIKETRELNYILLWKQLSTIYDPEISINIIDLGLIYYISYRKKNKKYKVFIKMTLTSATCGMGPIICSIIKKKLNIIYNICRIIILITFNPNWTSTKMSKKAIVELGL